jgi:hypothetical protein
LLLCAFKTEALKAAASFVILNWKGGGSGVGSEEEATLKMADLNQGRSEATDDGHGPKNTDEI